MKSQGMRMKLLEETRGSGNTHLSSLARVLVHYVLEDTSHCYEIHIPGRRLKSHSLSHSSNSNDNRW
jgi:hypothetical protein